MPGKLIFLFALAAVSPALQAGEIYRCVTADGAVSYTNLACPGATRAQHVASYQQIPDVPAPTPAAEPVRETAALDARLSALEAELARERALREAQAYYQAAAEQRQAPAGESDQYWPVLVPAYPLGNRFFGHHRDGHAHSRSPSHHHGPGMAPHDPQRTGRLKAFTRQR